MADIIYTNAIALTPGTPSAAAQNARGYRIACSAEGYFRLIMLDGSFYDVYASKGQGGEDGMVVVGVAAAGTPSPAGTGTVTVLRAS